MKSMKSQQSGFTLVEIAIVLVIIGLLLGGILKGQELINSAKVKAIANDFRTVQTFIYGYQDKYKAIPGDQNQTQLDANFPPNGTATVSSTAANLNNGVINGLWNDTTAASESFVFWQHVRLANLAPGGTNTASLTEYQARNAEGGLMGIQSGTTPPIANLRGTYVFCSSRILGKFAKQLDLTLDNGDTATGSIMVTATAETGNFATPQAAAPLTGAGAVVDTDAYTVCMGF